MVYIGLGNLKRIKNAPVSSFLLRSLLLFYILCVNLLIAVVFSCFSSFFIFISILHSVQVCVCVCVFILLPLRGELIAPDLFSSLEKFTSCDLDKMTKYKTAKKRKKCEKSKKKMK